MLIGGVVLVIVVVVLIFLNLRPKASTGQTAKLSVWGVENSQNFNVVVTSYPYATVKYTQIDPANYRSQLLSALAAGTGPDVFEIGNRDLPKFKSILVPFPTSSTAFGLLQLSQYFPDVVAEDFVSGGQIYGLPLSIDTLAMVYNKDLFNTAGIATPPATWDEFDADVQKLRAVNSSGQLAQAAAAIGGTSATVPNASDLLSLLMLQNGTQMTDSADIAATFASQSNGGLGLQAFNFYLQFANPASPYYTWNDAMGNAFDSFAAGKTAIVFAYQSDLAAIKAKAPFLNYGIAPMPQARGASVAVNYPKYEGFVAAKAGQQIAAWNFILYLTALSGDPAAYEAATGEPPALRANIQADLQNPNLAVFAKQALTAKSWYEVDDAQIGAIFDAAIKNVLTGNENSSRALNEAQAAVSQLMQ
jgi:multiple sugar transport system substrate-binding protein